MLMLSMPEKWSTLGLSSKRILELVMSLIYIPNTTCVATRALDDARNYLIIYFLGGLFTKILQLALYIFIFVNLYITVQSWFTLHSHIYSLSSK